MPLGAFTILPCLFPRGVPLVVRWHWAALGMRWVRAAVGNVFGGTQHSQETGGEGGRESPDRLYKALTD